MQLKQQHNCVLTVYLGMKNLIIHVTVYSNVF